MVFASTRDGTHTIYKQELDATTPDLLNKWRKVEVIFPRLSGDGSEILYADTDKPDDPKQPVDLMAVPIAGGTPRVILSEPGINNFICAKPPLQVCILNELLAAGNFFYLFDFRQGKGRLVAKLPGNANSGFSPDGSTLALDDGSTVRFVSIDSGIVKDVVLKDWPVRKSADWSADSKVLLIASVTPAGAPVILAIDLDGNVKVLLEGDRSAPLGYVVPSPDGKHGALDITTGESNVWMVENF